MTPPNLSKREQQVLDLMVKGMTTQGIAFELKVSIPRVKKIKLNLRAKFGADCLLTTVARAAQIGMVDAWNETKETRCNAGANQLS